MKQTLEKIVNSIKEVRKVTWNSIKKNAKIWIMLVGLGVGGYVANKCVPIANGAEIQVNNVSWNGEDYDFFSYTILKTGETYQEKFKASEDSLFIDPMPPDLIIYTQEPNDPNKMDINSKPLNTPGWDNFLGVAGIIHGNKSNDLEVCVNNSDGLEYREVIVYDKANPSTVYEILKDGSYTIINLPSLKNPSEGVYAIWHTATPPISHGDCASAAGPGILDGVTDIYDVRVIADEWLQETFEDENYLNSDVYYDGITNFRDFACVANGFSEQ